MNIYHVKMLIFNFLINILENYLNNHYNVSLIQNNTKRTTIKSRLLAQTQIHNPHYHNDPELKEIIDKMNKEAIKKYQQTNDPYKQLKEIVEKNGTKYTGGNGAEPISTLEKELLETYVETFGDKNHVMLKSVRYPNDYDESDDLSSCECTDINNEKLAKTKGRDKYLKHLKGRCTRGIYFCSFGSALLTLIGLIAAKKAALAAISSYPETFQTCLSSSSLFYIFDSGTLKSALEAVAVCANGGAGDVAGTAVGASMGALYPWGIAALVLIIIAVVLIILYIWLYRRRKNSLKHECKKHLWK
ncbi:stevor [Plasmodium reichenowi]|uniref:Stevor n=1 Tax=Plasmodium reichenowi TaxID=5854 RepID=A0A060RM97_PLARE|nr:stevor [Plasmodium reichenowi]